PAIVCSLHDISAFKEIDRLKDDFVSNVSHELRTPIANLKLHHDLIKLNPAKQDTYLERQGREIDRLTIIIESLLRLSRLDQRRIEINPTPVNLLTLAQQFVSDRNTQAEKHQLKLQIIDSSSLPLVKADEKLIGQVIGIILTNAITYTPPGGSVILKGKTRQKNEQLWVGLSITDTGPGIPADELDKIFARFYRGSSGRLSGAPGTGLGLAIAKEIMALHLGTIEAASLGLNMGSTFTIWLPAMSVAKDEPAQV
ncbi:MAG: HAMP domain-containing sensor histidine kinase, partial [Candidatus Promineifilaceae bacterium]